jgi:hypothetical protein
LKKQFAIVLLLLPIIGFSQIGGNYVYNFLSVPVSPRAAALGGSAIAINDGDLSLANENPALLTAQTSNKVALEYISYISDIHFGYASYAKHFDKLGTFSAGLQYLNGGEFTEADANGYTYGTFGANEYALNLSYAKALDSSFILGATLKPVYSQLYTYNSFGLVMDVGASYTNKSGLFTASLVLKNMGAQITAYDEETGPVPFDIQAGIATKLAHAPFRFSIIAHHLNVPDLSYVQSNYSDLSNVDQEVESVDEAAFFEKALNHMIFGIEFVPTKTFFLRAGYNYMRRQELKLEEQPGMVGFSWGFGLRIAKLNLSYANVRYHNAGISNQFAITTNLNDFLK